MSTYKLIELIDEVISGEWGQDVGKEKEGIKVIRTTNFSNTGKLDLNKEVVLRNIDNAKVEEKKLRLGDIIIEKSGGSPDQPVGRVVYFEEEELYLCNNFTSVLRPKKELVIPKFLMYVLFNLHRTKKVLKFQNKTTGIINLKLEQYLNQTVVIIPSLEIQNKVVGSLDQAYALIEKRQSQITALDELTQSLFLEMFGDPINNKVWGNKKFGEICDLKLGKMLDKNKEITGLIQKRYLGNRHVQWGDFILDDLPTMWFKKGELEKYRLSKGDLLICEGGEVGRCAIWQEEDSDIYYQKALHRARIKSKIVTSEFLQNVMYIYAQRGGLKDYTTTATIAHLTAEKLDTLPIPIPPIELQKEYTEKSNAIKVNKVLLMKGMMVLEDLYNSLLQKAFKGELFQEQ